MAKGYGLSGNLKGKKGSAIFYTIANSNNKVTQGVREYQPNVTNPRTTLQAAQRMKLAPLNNIYRVLQPILSRSFQGVKYGSQSRQEFIKLNLSGTTGVAIPYVQKGTLDPVPGHYLMSRGGLQGIEMGNPSTQPLTILLNQSIGDDPTFGQFSEELINSNADVQNGDQITFIEIFRHSTTGKFISKYQSIYVDTADTNTIASVFSGAGFEDTVVDGLLIELSVNTPNNGGGLYTMCAQCVIQSRQLDKASDYWARSTSYMEVDMDIVGYLFSASAFDAALESYRQGAAAGSDWETDSGAQDQSGNSGIPNSQVVVENMNFSISNQPVSIAAIGNEGHSAAGKAILWPYTASEGSTQYLRAQVSGLNINFPTTRPLTTAEVTTLGTSKWISYTNASIYLTRYTVTAPEFPANDDIPPTENP